MQIIVCVQQALDWNASTKDFRIDPATNEVKVSFPRYCIDQFDEIALEVALQYRARFGGEVRALTVGPEEADEVLRHALAMKADHATLVRRGNNNVSTAELLCAGVKHHGGAAIVLCGRTSSGNGTGQTGPALAEHLGLPFIANIVHIEGGEHGWLCRRETTAGYEVLKVTTPFVASVTNASSNIPRALAMKDVMLAHRAAMDMLDADALCPSTDATITQPLRVLRRYVPVMERSCQRIEGTPQEQARALAQYIRRCLPAPGVPA